jgi:TonB-linked SusC/RagA family outer membrane protein
MKKFVTVIVLLLFLGYNTSIYANVTYQSEKITVHYKEISLSELFWEVQKKTKFVFIYSTEDLNLIPKRTVDVKDATINDFMKYVLDNTNLTFTLKDNVVVIKKVEAPKKETTSDVVPKTVQQTRKITGIVKNDSGELMPGAFIMVKGSSKGVLSDSEGKFEIEVPKETGVIVVSFVGYKRQEVTLGQKTDYQVFLEQEIQKINEVVITGYQTIAKERATGSFVIVNNDQINKQIGDINIMQKFKGLVPGVLVDNNEAITIRGKSSLYANQEPIIVVDGFPVEASLSSINPNDIESITILRDAAAASIWGVRASNGVIVVTTKSRNTNKETQIDFTSSVRISSMPKISSLRLANSEQYIDYELETLNKGWEDLTNPSDGKSLVADIYRQVQTGEITNEQANMLYNNLKMKNSRNQKDLFFRKGVCQQYNLSIAKSSENNTFYSSVNLVDDQSFSIGDNTQSIRFLIKNSAQLFPGVKFDISVTGSYSKSKNNGLSADEFVTQIPYELFTDESGNYIPRNITVPGFSLLKNQELVNQGYYDWTYNLKQERDNRDNTSYLFSPRVNLGLQVKIIDGLTFDSKFQYELNSSRNEDFYNEQTQLVRHLVNTYTILDNGEPVYQIPRGSIFDIYQGTQTGWYLRNQLNYTKTFADNLHRINAIAGTEVNASKFNSRKDRYHNYNKEKLTYTLIDEASYSQTLDTYNGGSGYYTDSRSVFTDTENRYISYYANASYTYADKYSLSASARVDESNLFGAQTNDRKTPLYSFGASWNITKEDFFNVSFIDYLKLRVTTGTNGNIDKKTSKELIGKTGTSSYTQESILSVEYPKNDKLRWETTRVHNLGIDISGFNNRVSLSADFYYKKSYDLLGQVPCDPSTGFTSVYKNTAELENKGFDLILNGDIFRGTFSWNANLNLSFNKNVVTKVYTPTPSVSNYLRGGSGLEIEGKPIDYIYSYRWAGLSNQGEPQIFDDNGNIVSWTSSDLNHIEWLTYSGSTSPKFYGSLVNTLRYKGLSLYAVISYKFGYVMRMPTAWIGAFGGGVRADIDKRWRVPGDENTTYLPRLYDNSVSKYERQEFVAKSDYRVQSASNIRFNSLSVTYDLPQKCLGRIIKGAQVMFQGSDLGFWAKNKENFDPERVGLSSGNLYMENPPVYTFGINVKF